MDIDDAVLFYEGLLSEHRAEYEGGVSDVEVMDA